MLDCWKLRIDRLEEALYFLEDENCECCHFCERNTAINADHGFAIHVSNDADCPETPPHSACLVLSSSLTTTRHAYITVD